jgi:sulfide:quinone oxidoreductase
MAVPLYELALLTAAELEERNRFDVSLRLVTRERAPLELFGSAAVADTRRLLAERGIRLRTEETATAFEDRRLLLSPEGWIDSDFVVSLPRLRGEPIEGVPQDGLGFVETDEYGRVLELEDVYAAGDITAFAIKQGGIAAQQADTVSSHIAARAGAPVVEPFRPVLRGLLLTAAAPVYLRSEPIAKDDEVGAEPLWWPATKIFGRRLAPFLAEHVGVTAAEPGRRM